MSHEGDSNSDVYTSDHIDPSTSSFSSQHAIHSYSPFVADIYKYLQFLEGKHCPRPNYMQVVTLKTVAQNVQKVGTPQNAIKPINLCRIPLPQEG